mgnify:CR=1 FL=1
MSNTVIRLKPWEEDGTEYIVVDFSFDAEIVFRLREMGARLSASSGYWLIPAAVGQVGLIYDVLKPVGPILNCGVIPFNRDRAQENKVRPKALSLKEVSDLLRFCRNLKQRCLLTLMYSAGLRAGEAAGLKVSDLNFEDGSIRIRAARGRPERESILTDTAVPMLKRYLEQYQPKQWLFEGPLRGHYSLRGAKLVLKQAATRAGIHKEICGQTLRHSFTAHMLLQGVNPVVIQSILNGPKIDAAFTKALSNSA